MKNLNPLSIAAISILLLVSTNSIGQVGLIPGANDPSKADLKVLTDNRSLVSTTIDPIHGQAEGYVVGIDEGSTDINDFKLFLQGMKKETKHIALAATAPVEPEKKAPAKLVVTKKKKSKRSSLKDISKI